MYVSVLTLFKLYSQYIESRFAKQIMCLAEVGHTCLKCFAPTPIVIVVYNTVRLMGAWRH